MFHAAAMLLGLFVVWLLSTQAWSTPQDLAIAAAAAIACAAFAVRFGGMTRNPFGRAPQFAMLVLSRAGVVMSGALVTIRAALAADVTLRPALVRVKTRASRPLARAAFADMISAVPGAVVVESDVDGLLVHVIDEDGVDARDLGALETRVLTAAGEAE